MNLRAIKGMNDILPDEIGRWHRLETTFRRTVELYRYREVRPPMVEATSLFVRSIGEVTDIVEKEMYSFVHHGDELTLRPEGTAGVARAYVEHNVAAKEPVSRWYYLGPMFRSERPQKGRYRQFHQAGCEVFGDAGPVVDAEMIDMLVKLMSDLGLSDVAAKINTLGSSGTRARYRDALLAYLTPRRSSLSEDSQRRLELNPLRILDSKDAGDAAIVSGAPSVLDVLDDADREHFDALRRYLDRLGTPYVHEPRLVRGLDYYTRTIFELEARSGLLGAQNTVGGGGRYDHMVRDLGGPDVPAIGFGLGLERLVLAMGGATTRAAPLIFLAPIGGAALEQGLLLARELREKQMAVELDGRGGSLKSMLRRANSLGATHCVVLGEAELARGVVQVKDLTARSQEDVPRADAARVLAERIGASRPPEEA